MNYYLLKSEPTEYSIDDLARDGISSWFGIRNYQVRNMIRDDMQIGDLCLFYHSNTLFPGVYGVMRIVSDAHSDQTAFDPMHADYDPKSDPDAPRWLARDVEYISHLDTPFLLSDMRSDPRLSDLLILRRGNRLSITPISSLYFDILSR